MMSSKENFDDLKASFDDDLEQLNQEFDQLLLKNSLWNMHWSRTSCLMSLLRKMSRSTNLPQTVLIWMQQLKTSWNAVRKSVCKTYIAVSQEGFTPGSSFSGCIPCWIHRFVFTVDAVKLNVVEFIVRSHEMFTQFRMEDMFGNMPEDIPELTESSFRRPSYIPERFSEVSFHFIPGHGYVGYECQDTPYILSYSCMELSTSISLDTEDCMRESVSVNGYSAYLYTKYRGDLKGNTSLIWHDENYIYLISGPVNQHEILKIAESLY